MCDRKLLCPRDENTFLASIPRVFSVSCDWTLDEYVAWFEFCMSPSLYSYHSADDFSFRHEG